MSKFYFFFIIFFFNPNLFVSFCFSPFAAQFAGEDPVVALEAALQFEDTRESMQAFCVGQYMEVPTLSTRLFRISFIQSFHSWFQSFDVNVLSFTA